MVMLLKNAGLGGLFGKPKGPTGGVLKTMRNSDFMDTATPTDITLVSGSFVNLGDGFTIPAQQGFRWGYGDENHPANQGYIFVKLKDDTSPADSVDEDGTLRLVTSDANNRNRAIVAEFESEELDGDANDKNLRIALPEQGDLMGEDDLLLLEFRARALDIIQPDISTVRIPATLYAPYRR